MLRTALSVMFLTALGPAVANAQTSLAYAPTYSVGETIVNEVEIQTNQTLVIAGMNVETEASNYVVTNTKVTQVTDDSTKVQIEIDRMQIDLSLPGGVTMNFDTGNPNPPAAAGPYADIMKYLNVAKETKWELEYGPDHKPKAAKTVGELPNDVPEAFKAELTPEKVLEEAKREVDRLPTESVSKGDSWERNETANLGQGQVFHLVREYTYLGTEEHNGVQMEKIGAKTKSLTYEINGGALPLSLKESDLSVKSSEGTLWYHPARKVIVESHDNTRIVGNLTFVANGQELPANLDLTMKVDGKVKL